MLLNYLACTERMLFGDSPFVRIDATSSKPGSKPEDALFQQPNTCWEADDDDDEPTLTVTILSEGNALVTLIVMKVTGVSMVEVEYLPSTYSPVCCYY
jgi:hypothetical protein